MRKCGENPHGSGEEKETETRSNTKEQRNESKLCEFVEES
jgi:hypothetical protein